MKVDAFSGVSSLVIFGIKLRVWWKFCTVHSNNFLTESEKLLR
jgi:hypothetical protein